MKKLFIILAIVFSFLLVKPVSAFQFQDNETYKREGDDALLNNNPSFGPMTTLNLSLLINNLYCFTAGKTACPENLIAMNPNFGLIPQTANASLAILTNPPANTGTFLADMGQTLGFIPKSTYAQGVGFSGLSPMLGIWKAFRNIAYVLVSIMLIIVGFLIMFRKNIDPHTVVNIQSAIPRIIVSLILITFSYAIIALMIDAMYVILLVAYGIFRTAGIMPATRPAELIFGIGMPPYDTQKTFMEGSLLEAVGVIFPKGLSDFGAIVERVLGTSLSVISAVPGAIVGQVLIQVPIIGAFIGGAAALAVGPPLIQLMVALLVTILWIKLFFLFLGAYIQLIYRLIFGPLQIATGIIPGNNGFINWFRSAASQIAVFVVAGIMFMIATSFSYLSEPGQAGNKTAMWRAPYTQIAGTTESVAAIFSIGVLFLIPTIAKQVQGQIAGQGGQDVNATGAVLGGVSSITGLGMQAYNMWQQRKYHREQPKMIAQAMKLPRAADDKEH